MSVFWGKSAISENVFITPQPRNFTQKVQINRGKHTRTHTLKIRHPLTLTYIFHCDVNENDDDYMMTMIIMMRYEDDCWREKFLFFMHPPLVPSILLSVFIIVCEHNSKVFGLCICILSGIAGVDGNGLNVCLVIIRPIRFLVCFVYKAKVIRLVNSCCLPSGCGIDERVMSKYWIVLVR